MNRVRISVGVSDFKKIRDNDACYVDKTGLIRELLHTENAEVTLITRPRRFGKTMAMSMLAHFFDIRENSRRIFEGLKISDETEICEKWMNQYPVLFVSFKDIDGLDFDSAKRMLRSKIFQLCVEHIYLEKSERISEYERKAFSQMADRVDGEIADDQLKTGISLIMRMMQKHYMKPVILLIDEYDVPVAKANVNGYYVQMLDLMKGILSTALKDNPALKFAVVTGCLRITKESIFTGANNFTTDTISDRRYDEYFGFTAKEVKKLLRDADLEDRFGIVRQWYDGYHFGDMDIYCPWDVLNYIEKAISQGLEKPENFWENTSDNAVVGQFLERTDFDVTEKFETLLAGGYIKETISENLTYCSMTTSEANLWSLLYMTGYLTKARPQELKEGDKLEEKQTALRIPNAEVMDIFRSSVVEWFYKKSAGSDRRELFELLWSGNAKKLTELLSDLLFDTISFHDYAESFYHAFVTGLVAGAGYIVESNYENGLGRSDIVIKDRRNRRAAVIEAKTAASERALEKECTDALKQIEEKQYAKKIERSGFKKVLRYGIAFYQKECLVKTLEE